MVSIRENPEYYSNTIRILFEYYLGNTAYILFFIYRDTFPASYGEFQFMPVAYCPIEAYGYRWYGLILKAGEDLPDHYRRTGRLEILMSPDQLAEALRSGDRGGQLESFDSDLQWLITLQGVKAFDNPDMARHEISVNRHIRISSL
ncbi:hypothetical protein VC83_02449 [Pseudogymnoascus destructans]|uniref:Uncharacterized protein n=1 Tax=Pseudogymnoascus destructans TaxID=655981 RepID=A0A177AIC8_9PEZI|nr:uncharacterized protein VC83_02449 [Pseudogymnoascus destructans]OAF61003.1 hypothetical protein VC83_02449 [Pseudogymnoascus destructans]